MRMMFAVTSFFVITALHVMRINVSVVMAIIARANHSQAMEGHVMNSTSHLCPDRHSLQTDRDGNASEHSTNQLALQDAKFQWSSHLQELLLGAFYMGYCVAMVPAGYLADRFGGKWIMAVGLTVSSLMNILAPLAVESHVAFFFVTRFISGVAETTSFPAASTLVTKWAPEKERTKMTLLIVSGTSFGTASGLALAGIVCSRLGWASSFYIFGSCTLLLAVLWCFVIYEEPSQHPCISARERQTIETQRCRKTNDEDKPSIPMCAILTSLRAAAFNVVMVTLAGFVIFTLMTNIPLFLRHILRLDTINLGLLGALPYGTMFLSMVLTSCLSDHVIHLNYLTTTQTRKLMINIGAIVAAGSLIAVPHVGCSHRFVIALMSTGICGIGVTFSGIFVNAQDLAPRFNGTVFAVGNCLSVASGFIGPIVVGFITEDQTDPKGWRVVFYTTAVLSLVGAFFFQLFGSGEVQAWALSPDERESKVNYEYVHDKDKSRDGDPTKTRV
ncbi:sialin-like [Diadema antillarum]|uniref:sialin-like n=2 Tax=Diadema antillarum TaxID=105358 RepID=UPI003A898384